MSNLAENLRLLRESKGLKQRRVVEYLNTNAATYSRYEQGVREPSIDILIKLADLFNVSMDELIGRDFTSNGKAMDQLLMKEEMKNEIKLLVSEALKEAEFEIEDKIKKRFYLR